LQERKEKEYLSHFSVYNDIKNKLIYRGVSADEIAFIHSYKTDEHKIKLYNDVNSGKIRFLLGSTSKMGAGTNVQERLVGLHNLDAPWKPSDLEQREGRIKIHNSYTDTRRNNRKKKTTAKKTNEISKYMDWKKRHK